MFRWRPSPKSVERRAELRRNGLRSTCRSSGVAGLTRSESPSADGRKTMVRWPQSPASAGTQTADAAPPPPATRKADTQIKNSGDSSYLGDNIYSTDGAGQTKSQSVRAGRSVTYDFLVQNDGSASDSFTVRGDGSSTVFTVKYYTGLSGGTDITAAVTGGTYAVNALAPGSSQVIRAVITALKTAPTGATKACLLTSMPLADSTKSDTVKAQSTVQ